VSYLEECEYGKVERRETNKVVEAEEDDGGITMASEKVHLM
jgi:hypothetical protein